MKVSTDLVLRYCAPLDRFVKVRVFTETEIGRLLAQARFEGRIGYTRFILSLCLPEYACGILPEILGPRDASPCELQAAESALYELCIDLNPRLEISRVAIPISHSDDCQGDLYILGTGTSEATALEDIGGYLELEESLGRRVLGQEAAVSKIARVLRRSAAGLRDPNRPVGSFFFLGQTGVGKTELAKALVQTLYRDEGRLVRIDCSEYSQPHEYAKLIGAPPGYIGHQDGGHLTDPVRTKGQCVVLFDEVEKAHPKVHQLLLQVLDEGFLTDNKGRKASFRDSVIIMTSNVGTCEVQDLERRVGFGSDADVRDLESASLRALRANFSPEFINRIDEIVVFRPLGHAEVLGICDLLLSEVSRYLDPKGLRIEFGPEVREFLVEAGTDPRYGARPLRRAIQRHLLDPLADGLLAGLFESAQRIRACLRQGKLSFEPA